MRARSQSLPVVALTALGAAAPVPDARPAELLAGRARHRLAPRPGPRRRAARDPSHGGDAVPLLRRRLGLGLGLRARRGRAPHPSRRSPAPPRSPSRTAPGPVLVSRRAGSSPRRSSRRTRSSSGTRRRRGRTRCSRCSARDRCSPSASRSAGRGGLARGVGGRSPRSRSRRTTSPCSSSRAEAVWLLVRAPPAPAGPPRVAPPGGDARRPRAAPARATRQRRGGRGSSLAGADRRDPEEPRRRLQLPGRGARQRARRAARCSSVSRSSCASRLPSGAAPSSRARSRPPSILIPVVLALAGDDYLIARNTIAAVVPAAVCLGAGFATGGSGSRPRRSLCVLSRGDRARSGARHELRPHRLARRGRAARDGGRRRARSS